jgi:hypothetical protein
MNFDEDEITLYVKGSNVNEVAQFLSTTDNTYISFYPNNCNNFLIDDYTKSIIFGASNCKSFYQAYISSTSNNNINNIISFDENNIISYVDLIPNNNNISLGNITNKWKNIYINSNIYIGDVNIYARNSNIIIDGNLYASNLYIKNILNTPLLNSSYINIYSNANINNLYTNNIICSNTITTDKLILSNINSSLTSYGTINSLNVIVDNSIYTNTIYSSNNSTIIGSISSTITNTSNINTLLLYSSNINVYSNLTTSKLFVLNDTYLGGFINIMNNFIPNSNSQFDLGSSTKKWKNIYVSSNIYIGNTHIQFNNSNITLYGDLYANKINSSNIYTSNIFINNQNSSIDIYGNIYSKSLINSNIINSSNINSYNIINTNNLFSKFITTYNTIDANLIYCSNDIGLLVYNFIKSRDLISSNIYSSNLLSSNITVYNNLITNDTTVKNNAYFYKGLIVGSNIIPNTDNSYDIGTSSSRFKNLYLNSNIFFGNNNVYLYANNNSLYINANLYSCNITTNNIYASNIILNNPNSTIIVNGNIISKNIINSNIINTNKLITSNIYVYGDIISDKLSSVNISTDNIYSYGNTGLTVYNTGIINAIQSSNISVTFISSSNIISDNIYTSNITINDTLTFLGNTIVANDIIPKTSSTYDLGTYNNRWKDIYLSDGSLYIGNTKISGNESGIIISNSNNQLQDIIVNSIKLQNNNTSNFITITVDDTGSLSFNNQFGSNNLGLSYNEINNRPFNYINNTTLFSSNNFIFNGSLTSSNTILYGSVGINTNNPKNNLDVNGKILANSIQGYFIGDGLDVSNINASNIIGTLSVSQGGTGCNILPYGQLIIGNNNTIITSPNLSWNNITNTLIVNGNIYANSNQGLFIGDGRFLSNLNASSLNGIINIINGGTGCNIIPIGQILVGNNTNSLITSPNFTWNNNTNVLNILGSIFATSLTCSNINSTQNILIGDGSKLTNIIASNISGILNVSQGGTGCNILPLGQLIIGNNNNPVITSPNVVWDSINNTLNINGNIFANNIQGSFYGDGSALSNINANNISGSISVSQGGTGCNLLPLGQIIVGNNNNPVITTPNLTWNNVSKQLNIIGDVNANNIQGSFIGDGYGLSNINTNSLTNIINVSKGGTGCNILPTNEILVGNSTNAILTSSKLKWEKSSNQLNIKGSLYANKIQSSFYGDGYGLSNIIASNIIGVLSVRQGGTGCNLIPYGYIPIGNGNNNSGYSIITTPNFVWSNNDNKLYVKGSIYANTIQGKFIGDGYGISNINANNISGILSVLQGGLGCNNLPYGQILIGNDNNSIITSPNLYWNNNLNKLTINGNLITNNINSTNIYANNIQGSFKGNGFGLSNININNISGILSVPFGGTGCNVLPYGQLVIGNDYKTVITTPNLTWSNIQNKLIIKGTVLSDNIQGSFYGDGNGLSNINANNIIGSVSVLQGGTGCNSIPSGQLIIGNNNNPIITTPNLTWNNNTNILNVNGSINSTSIQGAFYGDGTGLSNINANNIIGIVSVLQGGTGCNIIPYGYIPVGNNIDSIITTPNLIWSNIQNKLIVKGTIISDNIQGSFYGDGNGLSNIIASNISGVIPISFGGTGCNSIPSGHLIIGNYSNAIITTPNLIWDNTQNKLTIKGSIVSDNIQGGFYGDGTGLSNIVASNIIGVLDISKGGTGCNILPYGHLIIGNDKNSVITTPNLTVSNNILNINGLVVSTNIQGGFYGDGSSLSNINANNIIGSVSLVNGGTGCNSITYGHIMVGNNTNSIITTPNLIWSNLQNNLIVNGKISASIIQGKYYGDGYELSNINANNIVGVVSVINGGTGCNVLPYGQLIVGNDNKTIITTSNLYWNNTQNKLYVNGSIYGNNIQGKIIGDGSVLSNINANSIIGILDTTRGGTGCNILPTGQLLIGNNNNAIITTPKLYWNDNTNTLEIIGNINANTIQGLFKGDGSGISNIVGSNLIGILNVSQGGTGCNLIPSGNLIIGNDDKPIITTSKLRWNNNENKLYVIGDIITSNIYSTNINCSSIVADSIIVNGNISGNGDGLYNINPNNITGIVSVVNGGIGCNTLPYGQLVIGNYSNSIITTPNLVWSNLQNKLIVNGNITSTNIQGSFIGDGRYLSNLNIDNVIGNINVLKGGTGCNLLPYGQLLVGNNTNALITTPNLIWSNTEQKLIINGTVKANNLYGNFYGNFYGINNSNFVGSNILGVVPLEKGGTGCNSIPYGHIIVGNYSNAIITSPNFTWNNSTNTLNIISNNINANGYIYANTLYGSVISSNLKGVLSVPQGGTGCNILPKGHLLVGNDKKAIYTSSTLYWSDTYNSLNIDGNIYGSTFQGMYYGDGRELTNVNISNIVGVISIANGGTGRSSYTDGNLLIGNTSGSISDTPNLNWNSNTNTFNINGLLNTKTIQGTFIGDGYGLSNVKTENIIGVLPVSKGGIGTTYFNYGEIIYGNSSNQLLSSSNLLWNNITKTLIVNGEIKAYNIYADNIHSINTSNLIGEISIVNGGTGCNIIPYGELLIGNSKNPILTSPNLVWSNLTNELIVKGNITAQNIQGSFYGNGLNISNIVASNIIGVISIANGGTGCNSIPYGNIIIGNNINALITTPNLIWSNNENKLYVNGDIFANNIQGAFSGDGRYISNIIASNLVSGVLRVINGGTGCNILPYGNLLVGNNTNAIITTSNLLWNNNTNALTINGSLYSEIIQGKFIGNGNYISNIVASNLIGVLNVSQGGTGCNILPNGNILVGNGYGNGLITTSNLLWTNNTLNINGNIITNNINSTNILSSYIQGSFKGDGIGLSNIIASNIIGILFISQGGTGSNNFTLNEILLGNDDKPLFTNPKLKWDNNNNRLLINGNIVSEIVQGKFYGDGTNISNFVASNLLGQIPVSLGGTGCNYIEYGHLIIGNYDKPIITTSNIMWNNDNNSLNINGDVFVNNIRVNKNIAAGSLPPSKFIGDALNVSNFVASNIIGLVATSNGGTGRTSLPATQILIGNNAGPIATTADFIWNDTLKSLAVNGTTYTNTLNTPTIYTTNFNVADTITANKSVNTTITSKIIQGKLFGDGINISNFVGSNIVGVVSVINGGTGCNIIPYGQLVIGNHSNAIYTTPDLYWDKNSNLLSVNGTINVKNINLTDNIYGSVKIQGKFYGDGSGLSNIVASNIIGPGILPVVNGGTGYATIPSTYILVGNGASTLTATPNLSWNNTLQNFNINGTIYTNSLYASSALYCTNLNVTDTLTTNKSVHTNILSGTVQGKFIGDGTNVSNLIASNLVGIVSVINGGTGCNILPKGKLLIGNNNNPITTINDLLWDETLRSLSINGNIYASNITLTNDIFANNIQGTFYGDGVGLSNIVASNIIGPGIIPVANGGTGYSSIPSSYILIGNGANQLSATANFAWNDTLKTLTANGTIYTTNVYATNAIYTTNTNITNTLTVNKSTHNSIVSDKIQGLFYGDGNNISNLSGNNLIGIVNVANGGTGCNILPKGYILIGNNTNPINTLSNLSWDDIYNNLYVNGTIITDNININSKLYSSKLQGSFYGDGAGLSNIGADTISGVVNVVNGGTGLTNISSNHILFGNGSNNLITSADLLYSNANNSLYVNGTIYSKSLYATNNIISSNTISTNTLYADIANYGILNANKIQGKLYGDGVGLSNIIASNIIGILSVSQGGTGCNILPKGKLLLGNDNNPILTLNNLYWDDTTNNLNILGNVRSCNITLSSNLYASVIQGRFFGDGANLSNVVASNIIGSTVISVANGGTGRTSLTLNNILIGNNTNALITTPNLLWDNTLNNLSINGIVYTNSFIASNSIFTTNTNITNTLTVNNKATIGKLYTNTIQGLFYGDGANISNLIGSNIIGVLSVPQGGTGCNIIPEGYIAIGNNTNPIKASSELEWNKYTNYLNVNGNIFTSNITIVNNIITKNIQGKFYGDGTNISNIVASNIIGSGIISVNNGGTGNSSFVQNRIIYGNGANPLSTSSSLTWDNSINSLNVVGTINANNISANTSMFSTNIVATNNITANSGIFSKLVSTNTQSKFYGDGYNLSNLNANNIIGAINAYNGGTGCNIIPLGQLLIGNNSNAIITTPNLTWNNNSLTVNGNISSSSGTFSNIYANYIQGLYYGDGSGLSNIIASNIIGSLNFSVANGGTGNTTLPLNRILIGNNANPITTSANFTVDATSLYINGTVYTNVINAASSCFSINTNITNNLFANKANINIVYSPSIQGSLYGDGTNISNIMASNIGIISVINGGTGCNILPFGNLLIGNNTAPVITTNNLYWNNNNLTVNGDINVSNLNIINNLTSTNIYSSNIVLSGWNSTNRVYYGVKYNNNPFYISLYLTANYNNIGSFRIPFTVNYTNNGGMKSSSLNIEPYYWNNYIFTPPVNGIYNINYSASCDNNCYIWFNKSTDISTNYDNRFGMQNSMNDNGCSTNVTINTTTNDTWVFAINNTGTVVYKENGFIGNTKASITLIQEII